MKTSLKKYNSELIRLNNDILEISNHLKDIDFELTRITETQEMMISHLEIISNYIEKQLEVLK